VLQPGYPEKTLDVRVLVRLPRQWELERFRKQLRLVRALFLSGLTRQPAVRRLIPDGKKPMKIHNDQAKEVLVQRLRRIEGQVHGVQQMLADERDCKEILQQMAAIRSAVQGFSRTFLQEYASACLLELDEAQPPVDPVETRIKREKIIQDMIAFLDKAP
jgi:DNA-binding FrmR family transcriptional regulator